MKQKKLKNNKKIFITCFIVLFISIFFIFNQAMAVDVSDLAPSSIRGEYSGDLIDIVRASAGNIIRGILAFIGSIMLLMIIYGGIIIFTSAGNPKRLERGKTAITWAIIGIIIIMTSTAIVSWILQTAPFGETDALPGGADTETGETDKCAQAIATNPDIADYTNCEQVTNPADIGAPPEAACINITCDVEATDDGNCCKSDYEGGS